MKCIFDDGGQMYDVFFVKFFVNCFGGYLIGSMVELSGGELGLVVNLFSNLVNFYWLQVKIFVDWCG